VSPGEKYREAVGSVVQAVREEAGNPVPSARVSPPRDDERRRDDDRKRWQEEAYDEMRRKQEAYNQIDMKLDAVNSLLGIEKAPTPT